MATLKRPKDPRRPEVTGETSTSDATEPCATTKSTSSKDDANYYFWGINELYVAP